MNPSDKMPTPDDIAPVELSSNTVDNDPLNGATFEEWLNQRTAGPPTADNEKAGRSLNSFTISLPRFLISTALLLLIIPALAMGGYSIYNSLHKPPDATLSGKAPDLINILAANNQALHINFDTTIDKGKTLSLSGPLLIQNMVDSGGALRIQNAAGNKVFTVDTSNNQVNIGIKPPGNVSLVVNGDISLNGSLISTGTGFSLGAQGLKFGGTLVCSARGCISSSSPAPTPASPTIDVTDLAFLSKDQTFSGINIFNNPSNSLTGNGAGLTALNAGNISSGTLSDNRLSANVVLRNSVNTFMAANIFQDAADSLNAFEIQNSAGTSNLLIADTSHNRIAINQAAAAYPLDVAGDVNSATGFRVGGVLVCGNSGCTAASGSGDYIRNGTTPQTADFNITGSGVISGSLTNNGMALFQNAANSTASFQIQNSAGSNLLIADTINNRIGIGTNSIGAKLDVLQGGSPGIRLLSGSLGTASSYAQIALGRTSIDASVAIAGIAGQFASGSLPGDLVLRSETAGNQVILNNGTGGPGLTVYNNTVGIQIQPTNGLLQLASGTTSTNGIYFGTDTDLYRSGAFGLKTDGTFESVGAIFADGGVAINRVASGNFAIQSQVNGDTQKRFSMDVAGDISWGSGSAVGDVQLYRSGIGSLAAQSVINSTTAFQVQNSSGQSLLQIDTTNSNIALAGLNSGALGTWQTNTNSLPQTVQEPMSVAANGYVYVLGGCPANCTGGPLTTVYYSKLNADGSAGAFATNANPLPQPRTGSASVIVNGYVYVIGGEDASFTGQSTVYFAKVNTDGSTGTWTISTHPLPDVRYDHSAVVANGYIYVVGGFGSACGTADCSTVYYAKVNADGSTSAWTTSVNPLPTHLNYTQVGVANGYMYVAGGNSSGIGGLTTVYYAKVNADGSTGAWTTSVNPLPEMRREGSIAISNGYLYVIAGVGFTGGSCGAAPFKCSNILYTKLSSSGSNGSWTYNTSVLPQNLQSPASVVVNGYIYVLGGCPGATSCYNAGSATVYYSSASRVQIGANVDLVGLQGGNLAEGGTQSFGSTGGSITAGNGIFVGALQVQGAASFAQGVITVGNFTNTGTALFQSSVNSTTAFQIQNAAGTSNLLVADTTNGRIGIGTAGPGEKLQVAGNVQANIFKGLNGAYWLQDSGGQHLAATSGTGNDLYTGTGGLLIRNQADSATLVTIQDTGKVGINNSPGAQLDIQATASTVALMGRGVANNWTSELIGSTTAGQSFGNYIQGGTNSSDAALQIANSAATQQLLYVRGDGNIGIGTTVPGNMLTVIASSANQGIDVIPNGFASGGTMRIVNPGVDNTLQIGAVENNSLQLLTANSARVTIDTSGNVTVNNGYLYAASSYVQGGTGVYVSNVALTPGSSSTYIVQTSASASQTGTLYKLSTGDLTGYVYGSTAGIGFLDGSSNWAIQVSNAVNSYNTQIDFYASINGAGAGRADVITINTNGLTINSGYLITSSSSMYSSSLPASPVNGQEVYYIADASNQVIWHLRYNASAVTYHWEYLGGVPMSAQDTTTYTNATTTITAINPTLTVPRNGKYIVTLTGGIGMNSSGCGGANGSIYVLSNGTTLDANLLLQNNVGQSEVTMNSETTSAIETLSASVVLRPGTQDSNNCGVVSTNQRILSITPVAIN